MSEHSFTCVPTSLKGHFRMVEGADALCYYRGFAGASDAALKEDLLAQSRLPEAILRFLLEMDKKLDAITGFLQRENLPVDFPHEGRIVEISGAGAVLECRQPLAPGDYMELLILLEEFPLRVCPVVARVEEKRAGEALTGSPNTGWRLAFTRVEGEDREAVIRFVFREERRMIRAQKGE